MGYRQFLALFLLATNLVAPAGAVYSLLREYSGSSFFDRWDFYGNIDNTTWGKCYASHWIRKACTYAARTGNVTYLDRQDALSSGLATVNSAGHAIMRVDDTTNIAPAPQVNRASVRLASRLFVEFTRWHCCC